MRFVDKATPINYIYTYIYQWQVTYNEAEKQQNLFNQSHRDRVHITPLVINALGGGHTHPHRSNLKKPGTLGLKSVSLHYLYIYWLFTQV